MDYESIYKDIQNLSQLIIKIGKKEPEAIKELSRVHAMVYGVGVHVTCHNCHIKAYHKLIGLTTENIKAMNEREFVLKAGQSFTLNNEFGSDKFYISHNLTDDIAREHLSNVPEDIALFEVYPENWDKEQEKYTDEQLESAYKKGESAYTLVDGKEKKFTKQDLKDFSIDLANLPEKE